MNALFPIVGWNLFVASLLCVALWLVCKLPALGRRPALRHGLWLLVLLKFVTPPMIPIPVLPAKLAEAPFDRAAKTNLNQETLASPLGNENPGIASNATTPEPSPAWPAQLDAGLSGLSPFVPSWLVLGLIGASCLGSGIIWAGAARNSSRLLRLLRTARGEHAHLAGLLQQVTRQFPGACSARLLVVEANITPLLWITRGQPVVVVPRTLADSLDDDQLRLILAHELSHYTRWDQRTSLFAFLVTSLLWWNPLVWLARRDLLVAAENCCDALAIERLAGSRKKYAQTLLAVADFVSAAPAPKPVYNLSFFGPHSLRNRCAMLAQGKVHSRVSWAGAALLACGLLALTVLPTHAQQQAPEKQAAAEAIPYFVRGRVYDQTNDRPIAGARVRILVDSEQEPDKRGLSGVTDADGNYRIAVPMGNIQIWFPYLPAGYWLDPSEQTRTLTTSEDQPIVTRDIPARRGAAWPVRLVVTGGGKPSADGMTSVTEVSDDALRQKYLRGESVSWQKPVPSSMAPLDANGAGAFTQIGESGKLAVSVGSGATEGVTTELLVEPGFDLQQVVSIEPVAETDKTALRDKNGRTATIGKAEVTLVDGLPLLTFQVNARDTSGDRKFSGQVLDSLRNGVAGVRVGAVQGLLDGGGGDTGRSCLTDEHGRFELALTAMGVPKSFVNFVLTKEGLASMDTPRIPWPEVPFDKFDAGTFTMEPGHALRIRTVDEAGKPLPGSVVEPQFSYAARRQAVRTDAHGRGVLRNLPAGELRVFARHGQRAIQKSVDVEESSPNEAPADAAETVLTLEPVKTAKHAGVESRTADAPEGPIFD